MTIGTLINTDDVFVHQLACWVSGDSSCRRSDQATDNTAKQCSKPRTLLKQSWTEQNPMGYPSHKLWKTSRKTGTNSVGFWVSRNGDCGKRSIIFRWLLFIITRTVRSVRFLHPVRLLRSASAPYVPVSSGYNAFDISVGKSETGEFFAEQQQAKKVRQWSEKDW